METQKAIDRILCFYINLLNNRACCNDWHEILLVAVEKDLEGFFLKIFEVMLPYLDVAKTETE